MKTKIYYFSGTGNTFASAKQIAQELNGAELIPMLSEIKKDTIEVEANTAIFMFPAYAYSLPQLVKKFFKRAKIQCDNAYVFVIYATKPGNCENVARKLLRKRGVQNIYTSTIKSVENYISMFGVPSETEIERLVSIQKIQTKCLIEIIKQKRVNNKRKYRGRYFYAPITSFAFCNFARGIFRKLFKVLPTCSGCGVCVQICPSGCIKLKEDSQGNRRAYFNSGCQHCQGCLNYCPQKALRFGKVKPNGGRYTHPDVKAGELNK